MKTRKKEVVFHLLGCVTQGAFYAL